MGEVSVMPQAWRTSTPKLSQNLRIRLSGQADPPMTTRFSVEGFSPVFSRCCSSICQTVGTAAEKVTPSVSRSSKIDSPSIFAPGMTSLAPTAGALKATPQALAWNIGTTGSTTSAAPRPITSACRQMKVWMKLERCEYSTPLGSPVVPEV